MGACSAIFELFYPSQGYIFSLGPISVSDESAVDLISCVMTHFIYQHKNPFVLETLGIQRKVKQTERKDLSFSANYQFLNGYSSIAKTQDHDMPLVTHVILMFMGSLLPIREPLQFGWFST